MKTLQIGMDWLEEKPGGLERYFYDCSYYLPKAGVDFKGLVTGTKETLQDSSSAQVFASSEDSLLKRWLGIRNMCAQITKANEPELFVSHFALYSLPLLDYFAKKSLVTHFHGPWALESDVEVQNSLKIWFKKRIEKAVYSSSSQLIVLSKTFRDILHQEYDVPLEKINIVPGGVDIDHFNTSVSSKEAREKLSWEQNRPTIFCIRRLAKRMGLENLVTAIAEVKKQYPDVMLYIGGKGALAETLEQLIKAKGLSENIKLLGFVADEDLPLCYRAANFSVVPTIALEGFGLIVLESLAAGTPVLGTPIGGIPEILRPFSDDLVFSGYEPEQLAQGIIEALSGKRKLPSGDDCLKYVQDNYAWDIIAKKIRQVYLKALKA